MRPGIYSKDLEVLQVYFLFVLNITLGILQKKKKVVRAISPCLDGTRDKKTKKQKHNV